MRVVPTGELGRLLLLFLLLLMLLLAVEFVEPLPVVAEFDEEAIGRVDRFGLWLLLLLGGDGGKALPRLRPTAREEAFFPA